MTFQTVLGACCAMFLLLGSAQAETACATEAQRKLEIEKLYEGIDWFLFIVEEVPEGVARQFRDAEPTDKEAFRRAFNHPLWRAHEVREAGAVIKRALGPQQGIDTKSRLEAAIRALKYSSNFRETLTMYADRNSGNRIVDFQKWGFAAAVLPHQIERYALCLVNDLAGAGAAGGTRGAPR